MEKNCKRGPKNPHDPNTRRAQRGKVNMVFVAVLCLCDGETIVTSKDGWGNSGASIRRQALVKISALVTVNGVQHCSLTCQSTPV